MSHFHLAVPITSSTSLLPDLQSPFFRCCSIVQKSHFHLSLTLLLRNTLIFELICLFQFSTNPIFSQSFFAAVGITGVYPPPSLTIDYRSSLGALCVQTTHRRWSFFFVRLQHNIVIWQHSKFYDDLGTKMLISETTQHHLRGVNQMNFDTISHFYGQRCSARDNWQLWCLVVTIHVTDHNLWECKTRHIYCG